MGSRPFEETGKLMTFFTSDYGKVRIIAKGAKRLTSRFMGRLETLSLVEIMAAEGRNLDILSQCEMIESFPQVKSDGDRLQKGLYFARVVDSATMDQQKNPNLFKLLALSLKKLNEREDLGKTEQYFEVNFLRAEGIFKTSQPPDVLIGEHLGVDIRPWKM